MYIHISGNTVLQTVGGQVSVRSAENSASTLVSVMNQSGAILQGGLVATGSNVGQTLQIQPSTGQKVSIAVTGTPGLVTNVVSGANVQMNSATATAQQRAHFMKQVNAKQQQQMGRSTITMPVTSEEMLLVKRQMVSQAAQQGVQPNAQVQHQQSPQQQSQPPQQQAKTQIMQQTFTPSIQLQSAAGGQQHIALVKTSTGTMVCI